ncbi:MAG: thioredoxin family protein [Deltaproteobacteria bacterium]|nr:MAG: thioredoxin family protein [Deltaproteobacteria bacterium]RUA02735.1 MAG: thioredoxin family protein [Deltaproteobacteria bacterium]
MEIKVLGSGCAKCAKTADLIQEVINETGSDATLEKVTDMMKIASYGVFGTPSVIIDNEVKCTGKVPKKKEIKAWFAQ